MSDPKTSPLKAQCTCGAVTLTLPNPPTDYHTHICFCGHCASSSSSGYQCGILVPTDTITITDTANALKSYEYDTKTVVSGKRKVKYFCGVCGDNTHLWVEAIEGMTFIQAGGTMGEQRHFLQPLEYVLYAKNKPDFINFPDSVTAFQEMPPPQEQ